jgi:hypothetical protein
MPRYRANSFHGLDFRGQRLSSGLIAPGSPDAVMLQLFIAMQH